MQPNVDVTEVLNAYFGKNLVTTLPELMELLLPLSRSSVYRRLKKLDYLTSFTHAGAYYTLPGIADFGETGL